MAPNPFFTQENIWKYTFNLKQRVGKYYDLAWYSSIHIVYFTSHLKMKNYFKIRRHSSFWTCQMICFKNFNVFSNIFQVEILIKSGPFSEESVSRSVKDSMTKCLESKSKILCRDFFLYFPLLFKEKPLKLSTSLSLLSWNTKCWNYFRTNTGSMLVFISVLAYALFA